MADGTFISGTFLNWKWVKVLVDPYLDEDSLSLFGRYFLVNKCWNLQTWHTPKHELKHFLLQPFLLIRCVNIKQVSFCILGRLHTVLSGLLETVTLNTVHVVFTESLINHRLPYYNIIPNCVQMAVWQLFNPARLTPNETLCRNRTFVWLNAVGLRISVSEITGNRKSCTHLFSVHSSCFVVESSFSLIVLTVRAPYTLQ